MTPKPQPRSELILRLASDFREVIDCRGSQIFTEGRPVGAHPAPRPEPAKDDARVLSLALRTLCLLAVAAEKADIYVDAILLQPESACRFCGCTDSRACSGGCLWIDEKRTVCSATPCFRSYLQEVAQKRSENAQLMQHFIETGEYPGLSAKHARQQSEIDKAIEVSGIDPGRIPATDTLALRVADLCETYGRKAVLDNYRRIFNCTGLA